MENENYCLTKNNLRGSRETYISTQQA